MPDDPIVIDASAGEGGGQTLRSALGLSALLQKPVELSNIRKNRPKPGLMPQHLTSVQVLAELCNAKVEGAKIGSTSLKFSPGKIVPAKLAANIGTAGSCSLLLHTILPAAMAAETGLRVMGGTDVPFSPPVDYLREALFPALRQMNAFFEVNLVQRGYYPKGNGRISFASKEAKWPLKKIVFLEPSELRYIKFFSHSSGFPKEVSNSQFLSAKSVLLEKLGWFDFDERVEWNQQSRETTGSGISIFAFFDSTPTVGCSCLADRKNSSDSVGKSAAESLLAELAPKAPVDSHLADQLIPFMALAKGKSRIFCSSLSSHTITNIMITEQLLGVKFSVEGEKDKPATISVDGIAFTPK